MAKFEHKDNSGSLFKNEQREKDTHPHMTGTAKINGVEYWVSAWTKEGQKGRWQSLAFKVKEERAADGGVKRNPGKLDEDETDSIPF